MASSKPNIEEQFAEAQAHHQALRFAEAQKIYIEILRVNPEHADTLHLLGTLLAQSGRGNETMEKGVGLPRASRAMSRSP